MFFVFKQNFSFKEYLLTQEDTSRIDLIFAQCMQEGGLPGITELTEYTIPIYIKNVVDNIIQKNIMVRYNWRYQEYFEKTTAFLFDTIGSTISSRKISKTLQSTGIIISHYTIGWIFKSIDKMLFVL